MRRSRRFANFRNSFSYGFDITKLGFSPALVAQVGGLRAFPAINVTGFSVTASVPNTVQGGPSLGADGTIGIAMNNYALQGALTKTFARHSLKFGAEVRSIQFNDYQVNDSATQFTFAPTFTQGPNPVQSTATGGARAGQFSARHPRRHHRALARARAADPLYRRLPAGRMESHAESDREPRAAL